MKLLTGVAFLFIGMGSLEAKAAFTHTDWKSVGDNMAVVDSDTGLEWLKGNLTAGKTIAQVEGLLSTTYAGWRLPKAHEVETMMDNFFSSTMNVGQTSYSWSGHNPEVQDFYSKMGYAHLVSGQYRSYFLYRNDTCTSDRMDCILMSGTYFRNSPAGSSIFEDFDENYTEDFNNGYFSVALVSDGGTTLSSLNNPNLNINNPNAPINQRPVGGSAITSLTTGTVYADLELAYGGTSSFVGYKYKVNGGAEQTVVGNKLNITGLVEGTQYTIEYAAYNNSGTGDWYSTNAVTQVSAPLMAMSGLMMLLMGLRRKTSMKDVQSA